LLENVQSFAEPFGLLSRGIAISAWNVRFPESGRSD
jgi:hypothetical protein